VEESAAPTIISNFLRKPERDRSRWVPYYTTVVSVLGLITILVALTNLPKDLPNFLLFTIVVAASQLVGVQLFQKSRSTVTFGSTLVIACIPLFGPLASVIISMVSAVVSVLYDLISSKEKWDGRASWLRRSTFNMGMYTISTTFAGLMYILLGGSVGNVAQWSNVIPMTVAGITDYLVNIIIIGIPRPT
jgi:hypothetical protein